MASFEGKIIAITGAGSGMGKAIATLLASRGAIVSLADRNETGLQETMDGLASPSGATSPNHRHMMTVVDVSDTEAVTLWIRDTVGKLGRLDGAVNFAGVSVEGKNRLKIRDAREEDWDFTMAVNAKGVWNCLRAELAVMQEGASIVNASSNRGLTGGPGMAAYTASKHAVIGLTRAAAQEEGERNIRINCVCPGVTNTPMVPKAKIPDLVANAPIKRAADPMEIATVVTFLLSDEASFVTGSAYSVDGGWVS